ncbi:ribose ABC transporter permease [Microvirgula aerodenitrificans]|uniref:ABC transporter permease n=1 Tax=Microvirgula aerodenitrificans TaxID=57480 RepID=UPI0027E4E7DA|nr:ribose ABC transporter permease [Microvirgula aerodenitrificans]
MLSEKNRNLLQKLAPLVALALISVVLSALSPNFLTLNNILNVMRQVSINALIAFGMTFVILTGGIDLSVGSILALSAVLGAGWMSAGMDPILATLLGVGAGALMGLANGLIICQGRVAPFIATLATMTIFRGLALAQTNGTPVTGISSPFFDLLGRGYVAHLVPVPVVWMLLAFAVLWFIARKTTFGRHVYAIGGNEEASRISGVRVSTVKTSVYVLTGALSAMAGVILTSRLNSAQPNAGMGYELDAIAAVVLGGTSLAGGRGWIVGTLIGALLIGVLNNGLNLLGVSSFYQLVIKGAVILLAVLLDRRHK